MAHPVGALSVRARPAKAGKGRRLAYNPCMLHTLDALASPALARRLTLLLNHVLAAEPAAMQRLQAHRQCVLSVRMDGLPAPLPPPPELRFRVSPAGLLEWCGDDPDGLSSSDTADLSVRIDASNPAQLLLAGLSGERPRMSIDGDAALAAEVQWLADNLRWDVAADLERVLGAGPAQVLVELGRALQTLLRQGLKAVPRP